MSNQSQGLHPGIHAALQKEAADLKQLALDIHARPETGGREAYACRRQVTLLRRWGFRVTTPFAKLPTAYRASYGQGRPVFCLMAEYDALEGLGHGCGHNLIAAAALGAGRALGLAMRAGRIPGTLLVIGTPAEETTGGKVQMISAGALHGVDAALMAHPQWRTTPDGGGTALARYRIKFHGKAAHAAAQPELGRNALDAVMLLFQGVNAWRQHLPETSRVHGIVTDGGAAPNIIPDLAAAYFFLRSTDDAFLRTMRRTFIDIARGAALMTGTRLEVGETDTPYRARRLNRPLNDAYLEYAAALGLNPVIPKVPGRGSTDFGDVSRAIPGAHVYFGIARRKIPAHSVAMRDAAKSAFGLERMLLAAEALAHIGYRFFTEPEFRKNVARDFKHPE